jgi:membrane protease YdiL (CAAX protease family)
VSFDPNSPYPWQQAAPAKDPWQQAAPAKAAAQETTTPPPNGWSLPPLPFSGGEFLAWLVIIGFAGLLFFMNVTADPKKEERDLAQPATEVSNAELIGKIALFLDKNAPQYTQGEELDKLLDQLDSGPLEQRYCQVLAINEFLGPEKALEQLDKIDEFVSKKDYQPNERQTRLNELLRRLLEAREDDALDSETLTSDEQEYLKKQLRWFGKLALNPKEQGGPERDSLQATSNRGTIALMGAIGVGTLLMLSGFVGLLAFVVLFGTRKLASWMPDRVGTGPIYAETFAIWLVGFFMAQMVLATVLGKLNLGLHVQMLALPTVFFVSLIALAWPVFRGVSWAQVRQDIGWTFDRPISDIFSGFAAYVSCLPLMGLALLSTVIVAGLFFAGSEGNELAGSPGPIHPIIGYISSGDWFVIGLIFVSTCVAAPIVEETMFRGVLFRSLRDRSAGLGRIVSVAFSALLNSLVFAAIHPQGAFGIPVLTTLAVGFSLARQWRGSLVAPIFMHFLNNFLVTTFAVLLMA